MDIHRPKSWHGWREFLKEFATIVLGVSVALAAEQGVEWFHWRTQVQESRQAIAAELAQNVGSAFVIWRSQLCADSRLDEVATILEKAQETGVLPPVGDVGRPPTRLWRTGTWDSMVASQVVTHFPRNELIELSDIYSLIHLVDGVPDATAWTDLDEISGPGRRLDPGSLSELRRALGRARTYARARASVAQLIAERTQALHLSFSPQDQQLIARMRRVAQHSYKESDPEAKGVLRVGFVMCLPMGAAPAHYGQSPVVGNQPLTDERLNSFPSFGE